MSAYYIAKDGKQVGIFEEDTVRQQVVAGNFDVSDLCWCEGMENWQPIGELINLQPSEPPPTVVQSKCFEVVTNVFYTGFTDYIWCADMFICQDVIYICGLSSPTFPQGGMAGYGENGNILKAAGIQSRESKMEEIRDAVHNARGVANHERKRRYGRAVDARDGSKIPVDAVESVAITSNQAIMHNSLPLHSTPLIVITCGNVVFRIAPQANAQELYDRLQRWHQGTPVYIESDTQGIELALPHPAVLFENFVTGTATSSYTNDWCLSLIEKEEYCDDILGVLKEAPFEKRKLFAQVLRARSVGLSKCLGSRLKSSPFLWGSGLWMLICGAIVGGIALFIGICDKIPFPFIISLVAFGVAITGCVWEVQEWKRNLFVAGKMQGSI